jgi:DNA-binding transcriptional regulator YiaG
MTDIKALRERLGRDGRPLSQEKLARRLGVSFVSVRNWESGRHLPSPLADERLARLERGTRK